MKRWLYRFDQWRLGLDSSSYLLLSLYDLIMVAKEKDFALMWTQERTARILEKYSVGVRELMKKLVTDFYLNNIPRAEIIRLLQQRQRK